MNKSQLIEALAKHENLTLKKAEMAVNAIFENIVEAPWWKMSASRSGASAASKSSFTTATRDGTPKLGRLSK